MVCDPREPAADRPGVDADGRLTVSVPCRTCGYDLRTLRTDGLCPECGTPVAASVQPGDLRLESLERIMRALSFVRLCRNAMLLLAAMPVAGLIILALTALEVRFGVTILRLGDWLGVLCNALAVIAHILAIVGLGLAALALWRLSRLDVLECLAPLRPRARRSLFAVAILFVAALAAAWLDRRIAAVVTAAFFAAALNALAVLVLSWVEIWRSCGQRARARRLVRWVGALRGVGIILAVCITIGIAVSQWALTSLTSGRWSRVGTFFSVAAELCLLAVGVAVLTLAINVCQLKAHLSRLRAVRLGEALTI